MNTPERRIIGSLFLLLGVSALAVAVYTGQTNSIVELLQSAFKTVVP